MEFLINIKEAIACIKEKGYFIYENALSQPTLEAARSEYFTFLDNSKLHASAEKFSPLELKTIPWRKQAIGSKTGSGESYSQLLQTTYFWQHDLNFPALCQIFNAMINVRNLMTGMSINYGSDLKNDLFWNACRIHHYPQGGGHMASHRDTLFPKLLNDFQIPFLQIMVTLSNRGHDFNNGGGYIQLRNGENLFLKISVISVVLSYLMVRPSTELKTLILVSC